MGGGEDADAGNQNCVRPYKCLDVGPNVGEKSEASSWTDREDGERGGNNEVGGAILTEKADRVQKC